MIRLLITSILYLQALLYPHHIPAQDTAVQSIWKIAESIPAATAHARPLGVAGPVTGVTGNFLLAGGGSNFPGAMPWQGGQKVYYDALYIYRRKAPGLIRIKKTYRLTEPVAYAASCSVPQGIVYAGGENSAGISQNVFLISMEENKTPVITQLPSLPVPVTNASLVFHEGYIYLSGGIMANGVSDGFWRMHLTDLRNGWEKLPPLPRAVAYALVLVQSSPKGKGMYVIGGRKKNDNGISDLYRSVWYYSFTQQVWEEKAPLPYPVSAAPGAATGEKGILVFGGDTGNTFHRSEQLIAAAARETDAGKKRLLTEERAQLQARHPGFCRNILFYDTFSDNWRIAAQIPFDPPVTTTAVGWNDEIYIPGGEIRAGVRTPSIWMMRYIHHER
ncbi:MAG TPA: hypothetical protein VF408_08495 [Sediminibacterium sp.]